MNLSNDLSGDKELFSGEQSSKENTLFYGVKTKENTLFYGVKTKENTLKFNNI